MLWCGRQLESGGRGKWVGETGAVLYAVKMYLALCCRRYCERRHKCMVPYQKDIHYFQSTQSFTYIYIHLSLRACQARRERRGCGCNTLHLFWNLLVFWQSVSKISWSNVVSKYGVFDHKKQNADFYQYPVSQISNFYQQWLLKKLYKICTDH